MRALIATLALAIGLTAGHALADSTDSRAHYLKMRGPDTAPYRIGLRCDHWAEDSLAHLKLVEFTPERIVLKCETRGY